MSGLLWSLVVRLYPARFRAAWGAELRRVAAEGVAKARTRGPLAALRVTLWFLWDALVGVPGAWREARAAGPAVTAPAPQSAFARGVDALRQDVRFTVGAWRRSPAFTAFAVATLAVGMASTIAIFSVIRGVLLRPMPYDAPEQLVMLTPTRAPLTFGSYDALEHATTLSDVARWQGWRAGFREADGTVGVRHSASVSGDWFALLGTRPLLGRLFSADDDPNALIDAVVLSWGAWQSDFGGRADIVGHRFEVDETFVTVIGVTPRGFMDPLGHPVNDIETTMYRLWQPPPLERRGADQPLTHLILGRMSATATLESVAGELRLIEEQTRAASAPAAEARVSQIVSLHLDGVRPTLALLTGAVVLLLLIGCANAANLLLSRATVRRTELAVRGALGAGRGRLVRQLLTESLLLALAAGLIGTWLGHAGARAIVRFAAESLPRGDDVRLDGAVVVFTLVLATLTSLLFGLAPALQGARAGAGASFRSGGRGAAATSAGKRLRSALVVAETALAVLLTAGAALLGTSLWKLQHVDPGYDADNVLTVRATLTPARFSPEQRIQLHDRMVKAIGALPGVESAAAITYHPLSGGSARVPVGRAGETLDPRAAPTTDIRSITADYFRTMGMRLLSGRGLTEADRAGGEPVTVINQSLARLLFEGADPVGRSIQIGGGEFRVVGVAADVREFSLARNGQPFAWITYGQTPQGILPATSTLVVRTRGPARTIVAPVRAALRDVEPTMPVAFLRTMREMMDIDLLAPRLRTLLIGCIGGLAALLAAVGLAGVMAYTVSQTIPEIGVRMALGAHGGDVVRMVLGQALRLTVLGVAIGTAGALAAGQFVSSMLFGVQPRDPIVLVAVAAVTVLLAAVASGYPALRAVRVSPAQVLRGL